MWRHSPPGRVNRPAAFAVAATALAMVAAGCGSAAKTVPPPPNGVGTRVSGDPVPARIRHLPLVDQHGHRTDLAAFRGKVVVISDSMTLCQETCPLDTANLVQTARDIDRQKAGAKVEFLTITVDPRRDTPAQLAAYRRLYGAPANWRVLTGTRADITALWQYFGVWYKKVPETSSSATNWRTGKRLTYDVNHADEIFFLDGHGDERYILDGAAHVEPGTNLPPKLRRFLDSDGRKNLRHPESGSWTVPQAVHAVGWLLQRRLTTPSA